MNIKKTLELHLKWINGEPEGIRANLSEANLFRANFDQVKGKDIKEDGMN